VESTMSCSSTKAFIPVSGPSKPVIWLEC